MFFFETVSAKYFCLNKHTLSFVQVKMIFLVKKKLIQLISLVEEMLHVDMQSHYFLYTSHLVPQNKEDIHSSLNLIQLIIITSLQALGFSLVCGGSDDNSICLQCRRPGFDPWVRKIPWRRKWQPTPVLLPGKFNEWRSLVGYSPWGRKELDMTERFHYFTFTFIFTGIQ